MAISKETATRTELVDGEQPVDTPRQEEVRPKEISVTDLVPPLVAIVALLGFAILIFYLITRSPSATELEWTRSVYLLSGVEAIAFAAAGFLFGKEVHRQQAEKAEELADTAQKQADMAQKTATKAEKAAAEATIKGKTLRDAILAQGRAGNASEQTGAEGEIERFGLQGRPPSSTASPDYLEQLARQLFPD